MSKISFFKTSGLQFDNQLFRSQKVLGHSRNRPPVEKPTCVLLARWSKDNSVRGCQGLWAFDWCLFLPWGICWIVHLWIARLGPNLKNNDTIHIDELQMTNREKSHFEIQNQENLLSHALAYIIWTVTSWTSLVLYLNILCVYYFR